MSDTSSSLQLRRLHPIRDLAEVTCILMDGSDYAMIVNGEMPSEKDATAFFTDIAPGKSLDDMLKLGIEENGTLIGLTEIAQSFPKQDIWHIGLLLLHTSRRNKGMGKEILRQIEARARSAGVLKLQVAVVEENVRAMCFWKKMGFEIINRIRGRTFGKKVHTVIELERDI